MCVINLVKVLAQHTKYCDFVNLDYMFVCRYIKYLCEFAESQKYLRFLVFIDI